MKRLILIGLMIIIVLIISGCGGEKCYDKQIPYIENPCESELEIRVHEMNFLDNPLLYYHEDECSNAVGSTNYGNIESQWKFTNRNNILLNIPCKVLITKTDLNRNIIDKKIVKTLTVSISAQSSNIITEQLYLPKCYTGWHLECYNISELSECAPVTKYRTERVCE